MGTIVNYDLEDKHSIVKNAMKERGYQDFFEFYKTINGVRTKKKVNLPNTTLYHTSKTAKEGRDELTAVVKSKEAKLEYILATPFDPEKTLWASYNL